MWGWKHWDNASHGAHTSDGWRCTACKYQNTRKAKVCKQCNIRWQYSCSTETTACSTGTTACSPAAAPSSQAVAPTTTASTSTNQHPTNAAIAALQASLLAASGGDASAPAPACGAEDPNAPKAAERKDLEDKIRALENAKASLPAGSLYNAVRENMDAEIANAKRDIINMKPLGMRLETCKSALSRAQQRAERLTSIIAEAMKVKEAADKEIADLGRQVAAMELQMGAGGSEDADCLGVLKTGMIRVLEEMATGGMVNRETIGAARVQMEGLFNNLSSLSMQCRTTAPLGNGAVTALPAMVAAPNPSTGSITPPPTTMALSPVRVAAVPVTLQLQHGVHGAQEMILNGMAAPDIIMNTALNAAAGGA